MHGILKENSKKAGFLSRESAFLMSKKSVLVPLRTFTKTRFHRGKAHRASLLYEDLFLLICR